MLQFCLLSRYHVLMPLAVYIKYHPRPALNTKKLTIRFLSYLSMTFGFGLLFWSTYPIFSYELSQRLSRDDSYLSPTVLSAAATSSHVLGASTALTQNLREFIQVQDWFPNRPQKYSSAAPTIPYTSYWISIPKLSIQNALVTVGGEDLSKSTVHYLPTTAPGEYGTVNIFGHSTLPQMYNVKDYKTIFTYLPNLSKGDTIVVTADNQQYEYEVFDMFVVKPDQISVLEPKYDASYITLITCVPPGTYWNRLVVKAKLKYLPFKTAVKQS